MWRVVEGGNHVLGTPDDISMTSYALPTDLESRDIQPKGTTLVVLHLSKRGANEGAQGPRGKLFALSLSEWSQGGWIHIAGIAV